MNADRQETTETVVRFTFDGPAPWVEVEKAVRIAVRELAAALGKPSAWTPADDQLWVEPWNEGIAIRYRIDKPAPDFPIAA